MEGGAKWLTFVQIPLFQRETKEDQIGPLRHRVPHSPFPRACLRGLIHTHGLFLYGLAHVSSPSQPSLPPPPLSSFPSVGFLPSLVIFLLSTGMKTSNNAQQAKMTSGRSSFSVTTPRPSMDEKATCSSPKEKGIGFKSFFSRLGAKRLSLPQLPNLEIIHNHTPATLSSQLLSPTKSINLSPTKSLNQNDAPPLSVAYSQAIRTAALAALTTCSDTILRRNMDLKKHERKGGSKFAQRARAYSKVDMEWTQKIFLLVPGVLLQFSGDGAVDRMPEKILQLTATSVAFASDAIPGRPYVLQVSQSAHADGSPIMEDNKKGSILRFPWKSNSKHLAVSFLLVFDTAKEMDSWMGCIRVETAKLAGTYVEEKQEEPAQPAPQGVSRRITIKREYDEDEDEDIFEVNSTSQRFSRYSKTSRPSLDASTSVTTAISQEQVTLNHLRGSRSHISMSSNGRGTTHGTSPETSPERSSGQKDSTRRSSNPLSAEQPRASMEVRVNRLASPRSSLERVPTPHPSRSPSPSFPFYTVRVPIVHKAPVPSKTLPISPKRRSGYSTLESATGTKPNFRRSSLACVKPHFKSEYNMNQSSLSSTTGRSRPTSMIEPRKSLDVPSRSLSHINPALEPRSLQRRSMTALGNRPDYGIGPPAFPPPQIPLPELPPEGYSLLNSRRKSLQLGLTDQRLLRNASFQSFGPSIPNLGNRYSAHALRSKEGS